MDPYDLSIRLKTLDGQWEEVGAEAIRYRGVWPENVQYAHDDWGETTASFDLRRDPGAIHPDLSAFTDCEIFVCGRLAWSGRVKETPTREGADPVINVQGEGWQYHMDDDQYERAYVHTRLAEYKDVRTLLTAPLGQGAGRYPAALQVTNDNGVIVLSFPKGAAVGQFEDVGVQLDLGPNAGVTGVAYDWESSNNDAGTALYVFAGDDQNPQLAGTSVNISSFNLGTGASGSLTGFPATPRRYLSFVLQRDGAAIASVAADQWVRLKAVRVATGPYLSAGQSILRADQIATDALDKATLLLDPDRSGIEPGVFAGIPEFATSQLVSPREAWQAANAYENYETKIDARRPIFRPRASAPIYEIGEWSGAEFEDASANSGAEILNRVFVEGQTAGGERLVVERWSDGAVESIGQVSNPSATVDASGWTAAAGTLSRIAGSFTSSTLPGYFQLSGSTSGTVTSAAVTETMRKGYRYRLTINAASFSLTIDPSGAIPTSIYVAVLVNGGEVVRTDDLGLPIVVDWTQPSDGANYQVRIGATALNYVLKWDDVKVEHVTATLVDRRGFIKSRTLPISNRITQASGERLGTLYLDQHRTTPFAGGFKAVGVGGVRRVLGGQAVHPGWLGRDTGQLVRANHVIDPDTGGVGRDERIKTVAYDHNTLTATVSLAEDRTGFDALLAQLAVVVGS